MWEEATYLCVHMCRGNLFTKPIPSYNLESSVAAWIWSDPCCHQKRGKKKAKPQQPICSSTAKNANKHLQSQPKGKNPAGNTSCVQRTCATLRNSGGGFQLPEQNAALNLWSWSSATVQRGKHQTSGDNCLGDTSQESYSSNDQVTFPSPMSL